LSQASGKCQSLLLPEWTNGRMLWKESLMPTSAAPVLNATSFMVRRKVMKLVGGAFHIYDDANNVIAYSKMKAFKLREDIRLYTGEDMQHELICIKARQIIDFAASYDVFDSQLRIKVGALRRRGLKSMIRDEWAILDTADREIGVIQEESTVLALVRRFVESASLFLPQKYIVTIGGQPMATFKQNFNPFVYKLFVDLSDDRQKLFDRRLSLAASLLLAAIEGKQN
jgi:hypothetical protein